MKFSLALGPRRPLDRKTAWGCLTTNQFGVPGLGSLAAGRRVGYVQMAIAFLGLGLTSNYAIRCLVWYASQSSNVSPIDGQSDLDLHELWLHLRWALLGMGVFLVGWFWALASSLGILAESIPNEPRPVPPKLDA